MAAPSRILAWRIPMDTGARQAIGHGVTESQTRLGGRAHTLALHFYVSFSVSTAEGISLSYTRIPSFLDFPPTVANRRC